MIKKLILGFTTVFVLSACSGGGSGPAANKKEETVFAVYTRPAALGELKNYLRVNGDVKTSISVDVLPEAAGKITAIYVTLGQKVNRGAVLAAVDPSRPGLVYQASPVYSPISGTVTVLPFSVGATVGPQTPVAKVARLEDLTITSTVAEKFMAQMKTGLKAQIQLEAYPGEILEGSVTEVSPVVDTLSRTLEVKMRTNRPDSRLRPGMFAQVKLLTGDRTGIVKIPTDAVVRRYGETYVFVAAGDRAERRTVTLGLEVDGQSEIRTGLKAGEEVVVRGQTLLEDKSLVRVVSKLEPLASAHEVK